jgi:hypothetical protein
VGEGSNKEEGPIRFKPEIVDAAAQGSEKVKRSLGEIEQAARSFAEVYGGSHGRWPTVRRSLQ